MDGIRSMSTVACTLAWLVLLLHNGVRALECFQCNNVQRASDCHYSSECPANQVCYTNRRTDSGNNVFFRLGCIPQQECVKHWGSIFGRAVGDRVIRSAMTSCGACCSSDYCNKHLCMDTTTALPPTTTRSTRGPGPVQPQGPQGGVLEINTHSYSIIGLRSPVQDLCFFQNQTFPLGAHFKQTCRYDCECTNVTTNKAVCRDVCPDFTSIPANCHIVHLPTECCATVHCDNTTVRTNANTAPCDDVKTNCDYYPHSSCTGPYEAWARTNCARRCGYCPGNVALCVNRLGYCDVYDLPNACSRYPGWARYNCKQACNMCHTP